MGALVKRYKYVFLNTLLWSKEYLLFHLKKPFFSPGLYFNFYRLVVFYYFIILVEKVDLSNNEQISWIGSMNEWLTWQESAPPFNLPAHSWWSFKPWKFLLNELFSSLSHSCESMMSTVAARSSGDVVVAPVQRKNQIRLLYLRKKTITVVFLFIGTVIFIFIK